MTAPSPLASLLAVVAVLAAAVLPAWAPFLLAERVRALFVAWPTRSLAVNYPLAVVGVVCVQLVASVLVAAGLGGLSSSEGPVRFFGAVFLANLTVPAAGWVVATRFLPARGTWDPAAGGVDGRVVLAAGGLWYAVVVSAVELVAAFVLTFLFLPV